MEIVNGLLIPHVFCNRGGSKQQNLFSQSSGGRSTNMRFWQGYVPSKGSRGEHSCLSSFWSPWLPNPELCLHPHKPSPLHPLLSLCQTSLWLPFRKSLVLGFKIHQDLPEWFPHLKILRLIISTKTLLPNTYRFQRLDMDISFFWGGSPF